MLRLLGSTGVGCAAVLTSALVVVSVAACSDDAPGTSSSTTTQGGATEDGQATPGEDGSTSQPDGGEADTFVPPKPSKVNVTNETLDVNGVARSYVRAVPKTYDPSKTYPLIVVFHGDGGDGPGMRLGHPLDDTTGDDAIVVYPTGRFNDNPGWDLDTRYSQNPDNQFIANLIESLKASYTIGNVFADGYSNGGFYINKLACRRPDMFRAIVSHAGGAPFEDSDPASSEWPNGYMKCDGQSVGVATMVFHGTADGAVTIDSGEFTARYWGYVNGCQDTQSATTPNPCVKNDGCPTDKPVVYCAIPGLGHSVWSGAGPIEWAFMQSL